MDESLRAAVDLFNAGRFTEFQDSLEVMVSRTRAASERQFYTLLRHLAEALHQISNAEFESAEALVKPAMRKLEEYVPRFRGINIEALREDFSRVMFELQEVRSGRKKEFRVDRLPRLRALPE
jgi:hypothetical protein